MIKGFNQFVSEMKETAPKWTAAAGYDPVKFHDAHFTFSDLKKSVKAICNKND